MAYVQIKSDNNFLSWILSKNPDSGILGKKMRQGQAWGYFSNNNINEYNVLFQEGADEISFKKDKDEKYEYINVSKYNSSIFVISAIDDFMRTAYKGTTGAEHDVEGHINVFTIGMLYIKSPRFVEFFQKHFPDYELQIHNINGDVDENGYFVNKNFTVKIATRKPVRELLNFVLVFTLITAIVNGDYIDMDESKVIKYLDCLNVIDAPYYIRYLFKIKAIRSERVFNQHKELLETSSKYDINMKFSDTWSMRKNTIQPQLTFDNHIVDLGCNDGRFIPAFAPKIDGKGKKYFAIDVDPEVLEKAERRCQKKGVKNAVFLNSIDEFIENNPGEPFDLIFIEVMEHMKVEVAADLVKKVLSIPNLNRFIITTPCSEFNPYYFEDEDEMRHDDHDFEMDREEFNKFITDTVVKAHIGQLKPVNGMVTDDVKNAVDNIEFINLGDEVNGVPVSQGAVITVKTKELA